MASYVTYWPSDWVNQIIKNGDKGPLSVLYGGPHQSQPPLGKVTVGDIIYPVTLENGQLYIMARMTIDDVRDADTYIEKELGIACESIMWDTYTYQNKDEITHAIPRNCVDHAAVGTDGAEIKKRAFPAEQIPSITLGPKAGKEASLKMRGDKISINNFSGYFRRLSDDSAILFSEVISKRT